MSDPETKLPPDEWDFRNVPDAELNVCRLWEYARESVSIRNLCLKTFEAAHGELRAPEKRAAVQQEFYHLFNHLGRTSILFQEGVYGFGGTTPAHPSFQTRFPRPWQTLAPSDREILIDTAQWDPKVLTNIPGFRRAHPASTYALGQIKARASMEEVFGRRSVPAGEFYRSGDKLRQIGPCIFTTDGTETLAVEIDWGEFTNEQLVAEFAEWLKANEPPGVQRPDRRGRKKNDVRASLDWLGIMRLLHRYTMAEMPRKSADADRRFGRRDWYRDRRQGGAVFRKLFPFLPAEERPLSWPTRGMQAH